MKLWQKGEHQQDDRTLRTERFTVGNDPVWDIRLAEFDVLGSLAHAEMLEHVKIIAPDEWLLIKQGLHEILVSIRSGDFKLDEHTEDVHSQVEKMLTDKIGEAGKKIHTGRSRNDQVLLDIKLFLKHELTEIAGLTIKLFNLLQLLSEKYKADMLPGYTHFQLAMPSSFGLWFGAYAESLVDDMEMLATAYRIADKNPLGSAAGYGSSFPIDRAYTTQLLGFSNMHYNSVYAQMCRGKTEKTTLTAIAAIAATLSKFAYDVCFYMSQQPAYISFPDSLTTGSSIMPHKKNPDIFELIRAKCNRLQATPNEMALLCSNLPSGYHRDMQLTKDILFPAVDTLKECLNMLNYTLFDIRIRKDILNDKAFDNLYSVEEVNKLVEKGVPFRDAYKTVSTSIQQGTFKPGRKLEHTHQGSIGNLCTAEIKEMMKKVCRDIPAFKYLLPGSTNTHNQSGNYINTLV